jgi:hypothetical protein
LPPTLTAPKGNITATNPAFSWASVPGATKYELWVDDVTDPNNKISKVIWQPSLTGTSFTAVSALFVNKNYRWWVRGATGPLWGAWSNAMDFTVK